jgi:phenylacetate-coenzyme A ligase PaaK-like adenylate-forming protein
LPIKGKIEALYRRREKLRFAAENDSEVHKVPASSGSTEKRVIFGALRVEKRYSTRW